MALRHWLGLTGFAIAYAFIVALVIGVAPIDIHARWQSTVAVARP